MGVNWHTNFNNPDNIPREYYRDYWDNRRMAIQLLTQNIQLYDGYDENIIARAIQYIDTGSRSNVFNGSFTLLN